MMAGNQTSVDYDQASSNSSEMATASAHADPAATTIDDVTVNQTTTTWSDHIEAVTCKDAYTRALEQLKACITATKADIDALKTNYDKAVTAFEQGDRDTAAEAEGLYGMGSRIAPPSPSPRPHPSRERTLPESAPRRRPHHPRPRPRPREPNPALRRPRPRPPEPNPAFRRPIRDHPRKH